MRDEKWGIIVNPCSGRRKIRKDWINIYRKLKRAEIHFTSQLTEYEGHAVELAKKYLTQGFRNILVVGGDGTINEVVNGIMTSNVNPSEVSIAVIPYGTGNDWARFWNLNNKKTNIVDVLYNRVRRIVDIGKIEFEHKGEKITRYFINGAGIGFDASVCKRTAKLKKIYGGHAWIYLLALFLTLLEYRSSKMKIISDNDNFDDNFFSIAIGNGCYSGGGLCQTPSASPCDGIFHSTAIRKLAIKDMPSAVKYLFSKRLDSHRNCHSIVSKNLTRSLAKPVEVETDGVNLPKVDQYSISIIPAALNMIV